MTTTPSPNDVPLIWTSKGNLPIADLRYVFSWQMDDAVIVFVEEYFLGEESVKRSPHVYSKKGLTAEGQVASIV